MKSILIKSGRVIDPSQNLDAEVDIYIEDGKIRNIGRSLTTKASVTIPAKGLLVLPGLIDMHVHLRDPGRPDKETILSGTRAAALGGFTSIACMPNTDPVIDNEAVIEYVLAKARSEGIVNVYPIASITKGQRGEEITEMGSLLELGAVGFSDDGKGVANSIVMRRALEYAGQFGATIISHCEDLNLSAGGVMNEGAFATKLGLRGIPALAEEVMVARDIMLAKQFGKRFGAKLHIAHVSTAGSVDLIRRAKSDGVAVTCETAPHYFTLTEEEVAGYNTNAKVNPPLRGNKDIDAIVKGLKDGTIDAIATDHAPHTIDDKRIEFDSAAFGMIGLETALPLVLTELVQSGGIPIKTAIEKLTSGPAKILGLKNKGSLKVGSDADVIIVDQDSEYSIDIGRSASKSRNSPFNGWKVKGAVEVTIVNGEIIVKAGKLA